MFKSSFCGRLFERSPSGRAFRCKSSLYCGLFPAIPNVGERAFTVLRLNLGHGLSRPGVRFRPFRQAAWPKPDIGAEGQTEHIRPCRGHGASAVRRNFPCPRPARKSSPVFVRQPEADHPPIYFSRTYLLALGNGRSRLSGRLLYSCIRQVTYHWLE